MGGAWAGALLARWRGGVEGGLAFFLGLRVGGWRCLSCIALIASSVLLLLLLFLLLLLLLLLELCSAQLSSAQLSSAQLSYGWYVSLWVVVCVYPR